MKPFLNRTTAYESTLVLLQDIIDNWLKVQAAWLYLEPIFSSDDITRQMPTEAAIASDHPATDRLIPTSTIGSQQKQPPHSHDAPTNQGPDSPTNARACPSRRSGRQG